MGSLAGLAGPLGLDPADGVGGGPADGAGVVAAEVDGDGVLGNAGGDDGPRMDAACAAARSANGTASSSSSRRRLP
jgi:hypothetical protein